MVKRKYQIKKITIIKYCVSLKQLETVCSTKINNDKGENMTYKIENENIVLIETEYADIDLIIEIENQQENKIFITPYDKKRHKQVIESNDEVHLTVWNKNSKKILGFIILAGLENPNLSLEFRRIVIQNKRNGFGRQCLQLIKAYCFRRLKFHKLWLDVFDNNMQAINLYISEGFHVDGHLRDAIKQDNLFKTLILFSILEGEYYDRTKV